MFLCFFLFFFQAEDGIRDSSVTGVQTCALPIFRTHHLLIDRPVEKGGADRGPMGGERSLTAVGGCFMSNLLAAIKARDAKVSDVRTDVIGTIADSPARFAAVELYLTADCPSRELLERLVEIADRGCIMMNTFRGKI